MPKLSKAWADIHDLVESLSIWVKRQDALLAKYGAEELIKALNQVVANSSKNATQLMAKVDKWAKACTKDGRVPTHMDCPMCNGGTDLVGSDDSGLHYQCHGTCHCRFVFNLGTLQVSVKNQKW